MIFLLPRWDMWSLEGTIRATPTKNTTCIRACYCGSILDKFIYIPFGTPSRVLMQKIIIEEIAFVGEVSGKLPRKLTNGMSKMTAALEKVGLRRLQLWPFLGSYLKILGDVSWPTPPPKKILLLPQKWRFFLGQKNKKPAEPSPRAIYLSSEIFVCQERGGAFYPNVVGD